MGVKWITCILTCKNPHPWQQAWLSITVGADDLRIWQVGVFHRTDTTVHKKKYLTIFKYNSAASAEHQVVIYLGVYSTHKYNVGGGDPQIQQVGVFHGTDTMVHKKKVPTIFKYNNTASMGHRVVAHLGVYSMHKYNYFELETKGNKQELNKIWLSLC